MGHLSQNAQNDAWLSHIAYMLDIFERVDFEFIHDRADITGNNNDETFQNRKYMEGNPNDPKDFGHADMQQAQANSPQNCMVPRENRTGRSLHGGIML